MLVFRPFAGAFELDPDEGNNLMKARLVADGHRMHAEVWSDQPPGFTYLLAGWLGLAGWTVEAGRLLVLLCAAVLMGALGHAARITGGNAAAAGACALLAGSFGFARLGSSVMLAVPSLMFAMLSVCMALEHRRRGRRAWVAASAVAMALAALVKLWTLALVPVAMLALVPGLGRAAWKPPAQWAAIFAVAALGLFLAAVPPGAAGQLLGPHLDVRGAEDFHRNTAAFWSRLGGDAGIVLLAVAGAAAAAAGRRRAALVPAAWAAIALAVLAPHQPLWYHHHLLVSIPLCWLGGLAIGMLAAQPWREIARSGFRAWGPALAAAAGAAVFLLRLPDVHRADIDAARQDTAWRDGLSLEIMEGLADDTRWVLTDRQIVPFRAGLRVPPDLAVTSLKRRWSGHMDESRVLAALDAQRPEVVLLSGRRIPLSRRLVARLEETHRPVYHDHTGGGLLVRRDLAERGFDLLEAKSAALATNWEAQLNLANRLHEAGRAVASAEAYRRTLEVLPAGTDYDPLRRDLQAIVERAAQGGVAAAETRPADAAPADKR
jgi:hypothetical protein